MAFHHGSQKVLSEINVTPFVDVMLVLLIIFMVTAPLLEQGINVNLPKSTSKESLETSDEQIVLSIDKSQLIYINKSTIPLNQLKEKLRAIFQNKKRKEIFVRADKSVPYGFVISAMDEIKNAGIVKVGLETTAVQEK